ncbi:CpaF family protein [bacterium]|nr:CpaF family protein [bacterium]
MMNQIPSTSTAQRTAGGGNGRAEVPRGDLKARVHAMLLESMDLSAARRMSMAQLYGECSRKIEALLREEQVPMSAADKDRLMQDILDSIFGLGPVEDFLRDPTISDILVNGLGPVYIEQNGMLTKTDVHFTSEAELIQVIQRIANRVGRRIDESAPMLDARLADGSRVNAIIPPLAIDGPALSIRRFGTIAIEPERLVELGSMTREMVDFMRLCVSSRLNILISGGTGSGKTTLLNVLSKWIPNSERIITIEDAAELQLQQEHVVRLEVRPPNIEGKGEVNQRDLLRNALRMRPDRIIIGEVRGSEALDMLQAMNTGHDGSMTTVHANNPRDALRRIETMVSMTGFNFPVHVSRQQMASALNLLVHQVRLTGGRRKIQSIAEVVNMEGENILLQDLFRYRQTGVGADGHAQGYFECCGVRPQIMERLTAEGHRVPENMFKQRVLSPEC